jgi:hypothetical protein
VSYLEYLDAKRERDQRLIDSLHGGSDATTGRQSHGVFIPMPSDSPANKPLPPPPAPRDGTGWGPEMEIENGAALLFPWLEEDER